MLAFGEVAGVLGLPPRERTAQSPVALITRIENGLPIAALDRVARLLAPGDAQFKYRLVPKATYERRKAAHRLSADESARLARVAEYGPSRLTFGRRRGRRGPSCFVLTQ